MGPAPRQPCCLARYWRSPASCLVDNGGGHTAASSCCNCHLLALTKQSSAMLLLIARVLYLHRSSPFSTCHRWPPSGFLGISFAGHRCQLRRAGLDHQRVPPFARNGGHLQELLPGAASLPPLMVIMPMLLAPITTGLSSCNMCVSSWSLIVASIIARFGGFGLLHQRSRHHAAHWGVVCADSRALPLIETR